MNIFEKAQCNKNICKALRDRMIVAEAAIKILQPRIKDGDEKLDKTYQQTFLKFKNSLEKIKIYIEEVSQIQGIKRYINANEIKVKFLLLTEEYETCMRDLNLTLVIASEEQRRVDHKYLETDIKIMKEVCIKLIKRAHV